MEKYKENIMKELQRNKLQHTVYRRGQAYSESDIFLAVLWLNGAIGFADVKGSVPNTGNVYTFLALALKDGIRKGLITIEEIN